MPNDRHPSKQEVADVIAGECLAVRVRLLNRTITNIFDDALRPIGLTAGQLNILVVLAKRGPISPTDVARRLNMEKSTVSRNIERMRKHGWLSVAAAHAGRGQTLDLRKKGRDLIEKSLPLWEQAQRRTTAVLGRRGAESIHAAGNAVWAQLGRHE